MTLFADILSAVFERRIRRPSSSQAGDGRPLEEMAHALVSATGETSRLAFAREILQRYQLLDDDDKMAFFRHIAKSMNIDPEAVRSTLNNYEHNVSKESYLAFISAAEPLRQELIRRMNIVPGATGILVNMRADLLRLGRNEPELQALDLDFRHLFASWFNRGFLVLRPISWESPAHILEKIIAYEAVHTIDSWEDLRRRLEPTDRRCFAFFHPSMPDEPLIFVEVALTKGIPSSVQMVLAEERLSVSVDEADTATFYSISNCQAGLAGISFGNSLIKQVASDLSIENDGLKTFVTLSPIPNLSKWLNNNGLSVDECDNEALRSMAAYYLINAKSRNNLPYDPVARFHLGNGAIVHDVHADADTSPRGQAQSAGVMVNYLYDLNKVEQNHEEFMNTKNVLSSQAIKDLANAFSIPEDNGLEIVATSSSG